MTDRKLNTPVSLVGNLRFYILAAGICVSIFLACWLRLSISSDQLFSIRLQQIFGYFSVFLWVGTLIITPLHTVIGDRRYMPYLLFSRRALGVLAAYFAFLHICIALWGQIDGFAGLALLPTRFLWALWFGALGFVILAILAATSFDKIITFITFKRWKLLHRLAYAGGVLALLHIWMIGTHMAYWEFRAVAFLLLATLFALEAPRLTETAVKLVKLPFKKHAIAWAIWGVLISALLLVPQFIGGYDAHHQATIEAQK